MTTRSRPAPSAGRSTFAVLASSAIHGAITLVITGLPASARHLAEPETLAIEMLAPEEPAPPPPVDPPPEPAPVDEPPDPAPPEPEPPEPPAPEPTPEPDVPPPEEPPEPDVTEEPVEPESQDTDPSPAADADPPGLDPSATPDPLLAGDAGTGFAVRAGGRGSGRGRSGPKSVPRREVKRAPPPAPAPVAFRDLSQRPKPPALDALLERNYPAGARQQGRTGSARVALLIGTDGKVRSVRVVSASEPEFGAACARTLRQSRWSPPRDGEGKAVPTIAPYECHFRVER